MYVCKKRSHFTVQCRLTQHYTLTTSQLIKTLNIDKKFKTCLVRETVSARWEKNVDTVKG